MDLNVKESSRDIRIFRSRIGFSLLFLVPIGFATKFYQGPCASWFNNYAGGMLYEEFWCLIVVFIWPRFSTLKVVLWILGITSFLECLQLYHPPFLQMIRSTFIGRTLIGTSFSWWDFPYYAIGCFTGWLWIHFFRRSNAAL